MTHESGKSLRPQVTVPQIMNSKMPGGGGEPLVVVTAYDAPTARIAEAAGVDIILVGDSLGMVVLGADDTLHVTVDVMVHHCAAVTSQKPSALVVADLPFLSYHISKEDTVRNAGRLIRDGGAQAVKLEGGIKRLEMVHAILDSEIPVMGHIGLTPQSMHAMGGFRVQGKELEQAQALLDDAKALDAAGVFAIVLEGIPAQLATLITQRVSVPTIGIGAGVNCDGQVLVIHDLLGLATGHVPKFVRRYASVLDDSVDAVARYATDVKKREFPGPDETYNMSPSIADQLIG